MKKLVLFDLDGVLLDSRPNMEIAWAEVCRQCDVTTPFEDYFSQIGRPFQDILGTLGLSGKGQEIEPVFRTSSMENMQAALFYEGVTWTLQWLQDKKIQFGVVTSKDKLRTGAVLARLPVDFKVICTPNDIHRGKPAPDHLLMAMASCRTDPAETVYIGDMDVDAEAASRAGIDYLHAEWGYGGEPDSTLETLSNIRDLVSRLEGEHT